MLAISVWVVALCLFLCRGHTDFDVVEQVSQVNHLLGDLSGLNPRTGCSPRTDLVCILEAGVPEWWAFPQFDLRRLLEAMNNLVQSRTTAQRALAVAPFRALFILAMTRGGPMEALDAVQSGRILERHLESGTRKQDLRAGVSQVAREHRLGQDVTWESNIPSILVGMEEVRATQAVAFLFHLYALMDRDTEVDLLPSVEIPVSDGMGSFEASRVGFLGGNNLFRGHGNTVTEQYLWPRGGQSRFWSGPLAVQHTVNAHTHTLTLERIVIDGEMFSPQSPPRQWRLARLQANTVSFFHHQDVGDLARRLVMDHAFSWARLELAVTAPAYLLLLSFSEGSVLRLNLAFPVELAGPRLLDRHILHNTSTNSALLSLAAIEECPAIGWTGALLRAQGWLDTEDHEDPSAPLDFPYRTCLRDLWLEAGLLVDALVPENCPLSAAYRVDYTQTFHVDLPWSTWRELVQDYISNVVTHSIVRSHTDQGKEVLLDYDPAADRDGANARLVFYPPTSVPTHHSFATNLHLYADQMPNPGPARISTHRFVQETSRIFRRCGQMDAYQNTAWSRIASSVAP
jgi:hypothetical protein